MARTKVPAFGSDASVGVRGVLHEHPAMAGETELEALAGAYPAGACGYQRATQSWSWLAERPFEERVERIEIQRRLVDVERDHSRDSPPLPRRWLV